MAGRGAVRLDTWLTKLLWALAKKNGGEIRVAGYDLDDIPERCGITTDYDGVTHEVVVRAQTGMAEMILINTEQSWTREAPQKNSSEASHRSAVPDDATLSAIENRLNERLKQRRQQNEQMEIARAQRGES